MSWHWPENQEDLYRYGVEQCREAAKREEEQEELENMKIGEAFPGSYLRHEDLKGAKIELRMDHVEVEKVGDDTKPVLYFAGKEKGLVLNKTNANRIAEAYGDETDDWKGHPIKIYPTKTDFAGKRVDCIRVEAPQAEAVPAASADDIPF